MAVHVRGQLAGKQLCSGGPRGPGGQEHCQQVQGCDYPPKLSTGETHLVAVSSSGLPRTRDTWTYRSESSEGPSRSRYSSVCRMRRG